MAISIGIVIGAGIGLGTAVYKDVKEDSIWFNGDWTDYVDRTLGGFVAGFGVGVCTILGAGVGAAALGGTTATLFTSAGLLVVEWLLQQVWLDMQLELELVEAKILNSKICLLKVDLMLFLERYLYLVVI